MDQKKRKIDLRIKRNFVPMLNLQLVECENGSKFHNKVRNITGFRDV